MECDFEPNQPNLGAKNRCLKHKNRLFEQLLTSKSENNRLKNSLE